MQKQKFDEIVSYFNKKVSEMEIETKYKMELLGMVTALGYAHEKETHDKRTKTHACDSISRAEAIKAMNRFNVCGYVEEPWEKLRDALQELSAAEPEDCSTCKYGHFGDRQCDYCRVAYPSHYERCEDE